MRRREDSDETVDVTIVVVTFNSESTIEPCLSAVAASRGVTCEVIVVDNNSSDGTLEVIERFHPGAVVVTPGCNLGFARGCNLGAEFAAGEQLLFLNPDTVVEPDAICAAVDALRSDSTIGVVGARTLYADGTVNPTCCFDQPSLFGTFLRAIGVSKVFGNSTMFNPEEIGGWDRASTREVGVVTGCFFLLDRDLFDRLGGFDERFFMYSEDTDLSLRIQRAGRRCIHLATAVVVHHGGRSDVVPARKMISVLTARAQFFQKHWPHRKATCAVWLLDLTVLIRVAATRLARRQTKWREVWRARAEWHQA